MEGTSHKGKIYLGQKACLVRGKWSDVVFTDEKKMKFRWSRWVP